MSTIEVVILQLLLSGIRCLYDFRPCIVDPASMTTLPLSNLLAFWYIAIQGKSWSGKILANLVNGDQFANFCNG